ncbi:lysophospholipase [Rhizomicrobium palustre]|uniref:Lysophospholipase n=1 Tax=Rhizomicrobium palustre TaxID=189966 RepID=A0A846MZ05_9PROT|nr:alpha/beta hydrolase [Rhizomicrobium palustre]NIK88543.1 lysophospholipase [Rhizomicrobium palustre]
MAQFDFKFISASDGRRLRTGVFAPERPRGRVAVLLSGQSEFIEKYLEVIGELNARGFTVATFDWRGQGGSARALTQPLKSYVGDFAEYDDDLQSFMAEVVAPISATAPLVLAHSMGGHMALRALHDQPGMFSRAMLVAPMVGISTRGYPGSLARAMTALQTFAGKGREFAWGMAERDPFLIDFSRQLCTSDSARFERTQKILRAHPELRLAGPTWGWIEAAYRSMKRQSEAGYAEAIRTPTLVFGAGKDRIVLTEAVRRFASRLPNGRYVEIADAEHEILMEADAIREEFWRAFDGFMG